MSIRYPGGFLTVSYNGLKVPDAPTIGTATTGNTQVSLTFTAPTDVGGGAITSFTATSNTGILNSNTSSPIVITGLTNGTGYKFTVTATNAFGTGARSAESSAVTPVNPTTLPLYISQGASSYISSPTGTMNGTAYKLIGASSNMNLSGNAPSQDSHNYYVNDALGWSWYIAANWGYGAPTRWSAANRMGFPGSGASTNPAYTTADSIPVYLTNLNGTVRSGTSANTILFTDDYGASNTLLKPGSFQYDAVTFTTVSGAGFASWYGDSNKAAQTYPSITTNIFNNYNGAALVQNYDSVGQGNDQGGFVWWRPPLKTSEVMIDFGDSHSTLPCALWAWNNYTGALVLLVRYGNYAAVTTTAGTVNDAATRTIIIKHTEGFVYFMGDYDGTVAGSHYYLYR